MRALYSLLHYLLVPVMLLHLVWRGLRNRDYWAKWRERFGHGPSLRGEGKTIWVHAVSVGEVQAALPLVRSLIERHPEYVLVVTTTTPTGRDRVRQAFGESVTHFYVPYDLPGAVNRFLGRIRPRVAIILETELWPNVFHFCRQRCISLVLANVRLSARSAAGYARFSGLARNMLGKVDVVAAQSEDDAARLMILGAPRNRVHVTGNIKFDVRLPASLVEEAQAIRRTWGVERDVWIAASTHEGEDKHVLDALSDVRAAFPNCLLVLVPRHPERFSRVAALCRRRGFRTGTRSENPATCDQVDVFIGDTMGELQLFYAASDVAFVGGSLIDIGGHNMLEPAALGVPVIFGPYVFNFAEISRRLCEVNASVQVATSRELGEQVTRYLGDANLRYLVGQNGKEFVDRNRGAGDKVVALVEQVLSSEQAT